MLLGEVIKVHLRLTQQKKNSQIVISPVYLVDKVTIEGTFES